MPRAINLDQKRSELVDAAWRVIHGEGLQAATLRRVAAEANCTTGALTRYFGNREALFVEALRAAHSSARRRMAVAVGRSKTQRKRLESIMLEALPLDEVRRQEWKTRLAFFGAASDSEALRTENARYFLEWGAFLSEQLTPTVKQKDRRQHEVRLLQAVIDGLALRLLVQSGPWSEQAASVRSEIVADVRFHLNALLARHEIPSAS